MVEYDPIGAALRSPEIAAISLLPVSLVLRYPPNTPFDRFASIGKCVAALTRRNILKPVANSLSEPQNFATGFKISLLPVQLSRNTVEHVGYIIVVYRAEVCGQIDRLHFELCEPFVTSD